MAGVWDDGGGLEVKYVGVGLPDATIEGLVAADSDSNAFTHTVESESEADAFRALAEELDADNVWDYRKAKPLRVYTRPDEEDDA